jgi:hypothetical protein
MSWVTNVMISVDYGDQAAVEELSRWLDTEAPLRHGEGRVGRAGFLRDVTGQDTQWGGYKYPECRVFAGALNRVDLAGMLAHIEGVAWREPEGLQVFVQDQEEFWFQVWMFEEGRLRAQIRPRREPSEPQA